MRLLLLIILVVSAVIFIIRHLEYKSTYYPFSAIDATPSDIGIPYEALELTAADGGKSTGWFIPAEQAKATVLFLHGNGGNIGHRIDKIRMFHAMKLNTLIIDYRGYGSSSGSPSEKGLYADAQAAYDYLVMEKGVAIGKIIVYGESLGGAVAVNLAAKVALAGIILDSTFTSLGDMSKRVVSFVPTFLFKGRYDSLKKIDGVLCPKLFLHSSTDDIVPYEFGQQLYEAAPEPKEFVTLQGGHNDSFMVSEGLFVASIDRFVDELVRIHP